MARSRQHEAREIAEESMRTATETGRNIFSFSTRAAEQSVNGFSRMLGLGQDPSEVIRQSSRTMALMQNWAVIAAAGSRDMSVEYANWMQSQMQANMVSLARLMHARTPDQLLAANNQLLGENIANVLTLNGRMAEISKRVVEHTAEKITELADEAEQAQDRAA